MRSRGVAGLAHSGKLDSEIWNRYYGHWDKLAFDAEVILAKFNNREEYKEVVKIFDECERSN